VTDFDGRTLSAADRAFAAGHVLPRIDGDEPCRGHVELFFPSRSSSARAERQIAAAKALCAVCRPERRLLCHVGAMLRHETEGIWGGEDFFARNNTSSAQNKQRRALAAERREQAG
jgi:hypothetical protein